MKREIYFYASILFTSRGNMYLSTDKLMHFAVGLAVGVCFWQLLEYYARGGVRQINPILFLLMLVGGASGLFLFCKLHIPILDGDFFYVAVPDWDIPLYNWTRLRFLIHRSWMFHSVLVPIGLIIISFWGRQNPQLIMLKLFLCWIECVGLISKKSCTAILAMV